MLKIRLTRIGKKNKPMFRLSIMEQSKDPYAKALEILGTYNPYTKELECKQDRIQHWLDNGAQMSVTVNNLLIDKNIIKGDKQRAYSPKKKEGGEAKAEEPKAEKKEEAKTEEPKAEKKEEAKPEEPKAEEKKEKTKAEEPKKEEAKETKPEEAKAEDKSKEEIPPKS